MITVAYIVAAEPVRRPWDEPRALRPLPGRDGWWDASAPRSFVIPVTATTKVTHRTGQWETGWVTQRYAVVEVTP